MFLSLYSDNLIMLEFRDVWKKDCLLLWFVVFVHGYFCNFIISNGNPSKCAVRIFIYGPSEVHKISTFSPPFWPVPKTQLLSKSCVLGLTKRNFRPDFFQKALFGLKMWKQTGCPVLFPKYLSRKNIAYV